MAVRASTTCPGVAYQGLSPISRSHITRVLSALIKGAIFLFGANYISFGANENLGQIIFLFGANFNSFGANSNSFGANSNSFGANYIFFGANTFGANYNSFGANYNSFGANYNSLGANYNYLGANYISLGANINFNQKKRNVFIYYCCYCILISQPCFTSILMVHSSSVLPFWIRGNCSFSPT